MKGKGSPGDTVGGTPGSGIGSRLAAGAVRAPADWPWPLAVVLVAAGLALAWAASYVAGGAGRVPPHLFYVPILLAAARFGLAGAVLTALVSGVVAGPLLPLDVPAAPPSPSVTGAVAPCSSWGSGPSWPS
jgi:hypothetical protein